MPDWARLALAAALGLLSLAGLSSALLGRPRWLDGWRWGLGVVGTPVGTFGRIAWALFAGSWAVALGGLIPERAILPVLAGATGLVFTAAAAESILLRLTRRRREEH